ncbi:MAG: VOC family protein, partial [Dehalococcoidia bacterium]
LQTRFAADDGTYAEMETGATRLGFASREQAASHLPAGFRPNDPENLPAGFEIAFTTPDVEDAFHKAVSAGATTLAGPQTKPWGQTVSYVRDPEGILVEICSPME